MRALLFLGPQPRSGRREECHHCSHLGPLLWCPHSGPSGSQTHLWALPTTASWRSSRDWGHRAGPIQLPDLQVIGGSGGQGNTHSFMVGTRCPSWTLSHPWWTFGHSQRGTLPPTGGPETVLLGKGGESPSHCQFPAAARTDY